MKRDHTNETPILLPLSGAGLTMVISALYREAEESAKHGDDYGAKEAYAIIDRANRLQHIDTEGSRQAIAALGIGFGKGRPQG